MLPARSLYDLGRQGGGWRRESTTEDFKTTTAGRQGGLLEARRQARHPSGQDGAQQDRQDRGNLGAGRRQAGHGAGRGQGLGQLCHPDLDARGQLQARQDEPRPRQTGRKRVRSRARGGGRLELLKHQSSGNRAAPLVAHGQSQAVVHGGQGVYALRLKAHRGLGPRPKRPERQDQEQARPHQPSNPSVPSMASRGRAKSRTNAVRQHFWFRQPGDLGTPRPSALRPDLAIGLPVCRSNLRQTQYNRRPRFVKTHKTVIAPVWIHTIKSISESGCPRAP